MKMQSIDSKLLFAQNAITNAIGIQHIAESLSLFGYDTDRLKTGETLYAKASDLHTKQVKEYGEQFAATDELTLAKAQADKYYMTHVKVARVALKDDRGTAQSLQLTGNRNDSLSGWLKQAKAFYTNAQNTPDVVTELGKFGITETKLQEGEALVATVETKLNAQLKEKGEAQTATVSRDTAFDALQAWMADFIAIARIALEDDSQHLEMLGIVEH